MTIDVSSQENHLKDFKNGDSQTQGLNKYVVLKQKLKKQESDSASSVDSLPVDQADFSEVNINGKKKQFEKMTIGMRMSHTSASSGFSSDDDSMASLGYEAMAVCFDDLEIDKLNMKDCLAYMENVKSGPHVERYIRTALNAWQLKGANVAVIGEQQTGKSCLINYLCGKGTLKSGKKPCKKPKAYKHIDNENLKFWEVPLGGAGKYGNKKMFLDLIEVDRFDFIILLTKNYIRGQMAWLSTALKKLNKPHCICRTFIDDAIQTSKLKYPLSHNAGKIIRNAQRLLRESYIDNGGQIDEGVNFHIIGNGSPDQYDMPKIIESLLTNSTETVQKSVSLSLQPISKTVINAKVVSLSSRFWLLGVESAMAGGRVAGFSRLFVDFKMVKDEINFIKQQLGISNDAIEKLKKMYPEKSQIYSLVSNSTKNNESIQSLLQKSHDCQDKDDFIRNCKNVTFRWWLTQMQATSSFTTVSGLCQFMLMHMEDMAYKTLALRENGELVRSPSKDMFDV